MALVKPIIYQVVGYQNSGKTTFLLKLIQVLKKVELKIVTIKHHGHGGCPDVSKQKDSSKHLDAGAAASLVEGEGRIVLQAEDSDWNLDEQIRLMVFFQPDIILIEGHKKQPYPKLLILRNEDDLLLLNNVNNITAVIVWKYALLEQVRGILNVPVFHISEEQSVTEISKQIKKLVHA
ncbi:molybdopterin-guanine dinucleotide biosynthesis protein B [Bacillus sp. OK048]|uniref:molybdopterin-guanine dinucleotide biosynthesis protein B n=1 Tax=Bacillus sp. OK048 TaxID=1882761 RepID=UPI000890B8C8|nr:molybdopterin-guanine dinucleotide biosynthesis protein B [Bacillus sp. OK048]SDN14370.1 molybdopterin-guanine dinucleotide biosynthesis protein B [Bacillus sp. OK048]